MIHPDSSKPDGPSENTAQGVKTRTRPKTRSTRFIPVKPERPDRSRETKIPFPDDRHLENPSSQIHASNACNTITAITTSQSPPAKTRPSKRFPRSTPGSPLRPKPDHSSDHRGFQPNGSERAGSHRTATPAELRMQPRSGISPITCPEPSDRRSPISPTTTNPR